MATNLRTTRYRDGTTISNVTDGAVWVQLNTRAWCNYQNNPGHDATYGKLYNWYAAANQNICPQGWHLPSDSDWKELEMALGLPLGQIDQLEVRGSDQRVGGKMKATTLWNTPNTGATNECGFSGFPGGARYGNDGNFYGLGNFGSWWTGSASGSDTAWGRYLYKQDAGIARNDNYLKRNGFCLRCVRD